MTDLRLDAPDRPSARADRHFRYFGMRIPEWWQATAFALVLGIMGLMGETTGSSTYGLIYLGSIGVVAVLFPHYVLAANTRNVLLWLYPLWMMCSTAWSIDPDRTSHSALLVCGSMVGVCALGALPYRREISTALFLILFVYIIISLIFGHRIGLGVDGTAFAGLLNGKNMFGHLSAMETIGSLAMLAWWANPQTRPLALLGLLGIPIGLVALVLSKASGALISTCISFGAFAVFLAFRRLPVMWKVTAVAAIVAAAVIYVTFGEEIEREVFARVLQQFGKDTTLTGRTMLWEVADRYIGERPWLGVGYSAFWYVTNPEAWVLWRLMQVGPNSGFSFHNTPRDVLVDTGFIGLALFATGLGWSAARKLGTALTTGDVLLGARAAMVTYFLIRVPVETLGYSQLSYDALVLLGYLCIDAVPAPKPAPPPPVRWREAAAVPHRGRALRPAARGPRFRT